MRIANIVIAFRANMCVRFCCVDVCDFFYFCVLSTYHSALASGVLLLSAADVHRVCATTRVISFDGTHRQAGRQAGADLNHQV